MILTPTITFKTPTQKKDSMVKPESKTSLASFGGDCFQRSNKTPSKPDFVTPFTGLNRSISRRLYDSNLDVQLLLDKYPKSNGIVGNLPSDWISKLTPTSKKEQIKFIYSEFARATNSLTIDAYDAGKYRYDLEQFNKDINPKLHQARNIIEESLKKTGVIDSEQSINLQFIGLGFYGCAYKFNVGEKTYVLKVFHSNDEAQYRMKHYHGGLIEANRSAFIHKNAPQSQFAPFFFADLKSKHMVTSFIDSSMSLPEKIIEESHFGIHYADAEDEKKEANVKQDYFIDYGGIEILNPLLAKNKTARWVYKSIKIKNKPDNWQESWNILFRAAKKHHISNKNDVLMGLITTISLLPQEVQSQKFNDIVKISDSNLNPKMLIFMESVPENLRIEAFKHLLQNPKPQIKDDLLKRINLIPVNKKDEILQLLLSSDHSGKHSDLISNIKDLSAQIRDDVMNLIDVNANVFAVDSFFEHIPALPPDDQKRIYDLIVKNANREMKGWLFFNLRKLPEPVQLDVFKSIYNNSDKIQQKFIHKNITALPQNIKHDAFKHIKTSQKSDSLFSEE